MSTDSDFYHCIDRGRRHPLQELVVDTFVPNDAILLGHSADSDRPTNHDDGDSELSHPIMEKNSIVICTGANACGKVRCLCVSMTEYNFNESVERISEASE